MHVSCTFNYVIKTEKSHSRDLITINAAFVTGFYCSMTRAMEIVGLCEQIGCCFNYIIYGTIFELCLSAHHPLMPMWRPRSSMLLTSSFVPSNECTCNRLNCHYVDTVGNLRAQVAGEML